MPTLTLKYNENVLGVYKTEKAETLTIGRHKDNDIVIVNLGASGHHAKIENLDDTFLLTDLDSTNGSFVNEEPIVTHRLKDGDVVTIAKHSLVFTDDEKESETGETESLMDKTMVLDTEKHRSMLAKGGATQPNGVQEKETAATLTFLTGHCGTLSLTKKLTRIGKGSDSDIAVKGFMVGKNAAVISTRPNGCYLSYVGGISKPKVNGSVVKQTVKLNRDDVITLGSSKIQFSC
jgi:pSer/pThr/pTyr-binding forkhead associated (FHA) protein